MAQEPQKLNEREFKCVALWRAERAIRNLAEKLRPTERIDPDHAVYLLSEILDEMWRAYVDYEEFEKPE